MFVFYNWVEWHTWKALDMRVNLPFAVYLGCEVDDAETYLGVSVLILYIGYIMPAWTTPILIVLSPYIKIDNQENQSRAGRVAHW